MDDVTLQARLNDAENQISFLNTTIKTLEQENKELKRLYLQMRACFNDYTDIVTHFNKLNVILNEMDKILWR
jgi:uncharacterized coiled-coil protein SlyX